MREVLKIAQDKLDLHYADRDGAVVIIPSLGNIYDGKTLLGRSLTRPGYGCEHGYEKGSCPRDGCPHVIDTGPARPEIVCLCGSTRFYEEFQKANYRFTMEGKIVLTVGFYPHSQNQAHGEQLGCTPEQKLLLDNLHLRKIDLADRVFVLNKDGYIGDSTRRELAYAIFKGKGIDFLEPGAGEHFMQERSHELGRLVASFVAQS